MGPGRKEGPEGRAATLAGCPEGAASAPGKLGQPGEGPAPHPRPRCVPRAQLRGTGRPEAAAPRLCPPSPLLSSDWGAQRLRRLVCRVGGGRGEAAASEGQVRSRLLAGQECASEPPTALPLSLCAFPVSPADAENTGLQRGHGKGGRQRPEESLHPRRAAAAGFSRGPQAGGTWVEENVMSAELWWQRTLHRVKGWLQMPGMHSCWEQVPSGVSLGSRHSP